MVNRNWTQITKGVVTKFNERAGYYLWRDYLEVRILMIADLLTVRDKCFLDIGSGFGILSHFAAKHNYLVGIDNDFLRLNSASETGVDLVQGDIFYLPFKSKIFDGVIMGSIIWQSAIDRLLAEVIKTTKVGGYLFANTRNKNYWLPLFDSEHSFSIKELKHTFRKYGLNPKVRGFNPFFISNKLTKLLFKLWYVPFFLFLKYLSTKRAAANRSKHLYVNAQRVSDS